MSVVEWLASVTQSRKSVDGVASVVVFGSVAMRNGGGCQGSRLTGRRSVLCSLVGGCAARIAWVSWGSIGVVVGVAMLSGCGYQGSRLAGRLSILTKGTIRG